MNAAISTALLSLFTVFAAPNAGGDSPTEGARKGKRGHGGICKKLECTDDQKTKIKAIRAALKADNADERAAAKELRERYRAAKSADNPNPEALAKMRAEMKALKKTMKAARAESKAEIKEVLTPEQREMLVALKAERKAKRHKKGKKGKKGKRGKKHGDKQGKKANKGDKRGDKGEFARRGDNPRGGDKARGERRGKRDKVTKRDRKGKRDRGEFAGRRGNERSELARAGRRNNG